MGFLVKHELDIKSRKKRIECKMREYSSEKNDDNETIRYLKELNEGLNLLQHQQKREVK